MRMHNAANQKRSKKVTIFRKLMYFVGLSLIISLWHVLSSAQADGVHSVHSGWSVHTSRRRHRHTFAVYQGPRWVRIMKKTGGRKSCDTLPLTFLVFFLVSEAPLCCHVVVVAKQKKLSRAQLCPWVTTKRRDHVLTGKPCRSSGQLTWRRV